MIRLQFITAAHHFIETKGFVWFAGKGCYLYSVDLASCNVLVQLHQCLKFGQVFGFNVGHCSQLYCHAAVIHVVQEVEVKAL